MSGNQKDSRLVRLSGCRTAYTSTMESACLMFANNCARSPGSAAANRGRNGSVKGPEMATTVTRREGGREKVLVTEEGIFGRGNTKPASDTTKRFSGIDRLVHCGTSLGPLLSSNSLDATVLNLGISPALTKDWCSDPRTTVGDHATAELTETSGGTFNSRDEF